jgi:serine/threonine-protein kinase RsbW
MLKEFPRDFSSLSLILAFTEEFFAAKGLDQDHVPRINFAIEELFTNMVKYNQDGEHPIRIGLNVSGRALVIRISDVEVEPFDPTTVPDADIGQRVEDRPIGKLGLHLVRRMVDGIEYQYENRTSTVILTKKLE